MSVRSHALGRGPVPAFSTAYAEHDLPTEIIGRIAGHSVDLSQLHAMACTCARWKSATEPLIAKIAAGFQDALKDGAALGPFPAAVSLKLACAWLQSRLQNHFPELRAEDQAQLALAFVQHLPELQQAPGWSLALRRVQTDPAWLGSLCQSLLLHEDKAAAEQHIETLLSSLVPPSVLIAWLQTGPALEAPVWRAMISRQLRWTGEGASSLALRVFSFPLGNSPVAIEGLRLFYKEACNLAQAIAAERGKPLFHLIVACAASLKAQGESQAADFLHALLKCTGLRVEDLAAIADTQARFGVV